MATEEPFKTPEELLEYCRMHSRTERALFHKDHIQKVYELAGKQMPALPEQMPNFVTVREESMDNLVGAAYARLSKLHPRQAVDGPWDCDNCGTNNHELRTRRCRSCGVEAPPPKPVESKVLRPMDMVAAVQVTIQVDVTGAQNIHDSILVDRTKIEEAMKAATDALQMKLGPAYKIVAINLVEKKEEPPKGSLEWAENEGGGLTMDEQRDKRT